MMKISIIASNERGRLEREVGLAFSSLIFWGSHRAAGQVECGDSLPQKIRFCLSFFSLGENSNALRVRKRQCLFLVKQTIFRLECSCHFTGGFYAGQDSFPSPSSHLFFVFIGPSRSHTTFLPLHFEPICHPVTTCCSTTAPTVKT